MTETSPADLASTPYVLLTTFRKTGLPISTPVWVVGGLGGLLITTSGASGKVKRIRNNDAVELAPCDARGNLGTDAKTRGRAVVLTDADSRAVIDEALERKYGLRYREIKAAGRLRGATANSVVVRITTH